MYAEIRYGNSWVPCFFVFIYIYVFFPHQKKIHTYIYKKKKHGTQEFPYLISAYIFSLLNYKVLHSVLKTPLKDL